MSADVHVEFRQARRAYELGRLRVSLARAIPSPAVGAVRVGTHGPTSLAALR